MNGEITFDVIIPDTGMDHIEGCYRLADGEWTVFYFTHYVRGSLHIGAPIIKREAIFSSGVVGVDAAFPSDIVLNKRTSMDILSDILGGVAWVEVLGPDSLRIKYPCRTVVAD